MLGGSAAPRRYGQFVEPDITPESDEEDLLPPETDYDRHEHIDDFYGPGLEYDNVFNVDGSLSEPAPIDWPTGMNVGFS